MHFGLWKMRTFTPPHLRPHGGKSKPFSEALMGLDRGPVAEQLRSEQGRVARNVAKRFLLVLKKSEKILPWGTNSFISFVILHNIILMDQEPETFFKGGSFSALVKLFWHDLTCLTLFLQVRMIFSFEWQEGLRFMIHATVRKCSVVVAFLGGRGRGIQYIRDSNPRSSYLEVDSLPLGKTVVFLKFFLITLLSCFLRIDFHTLHFCPYDCFLIKDQQPV